MVNSSALASQFQNTIRGEQEDRGGRGSRPKCTYCHQWGHTREKCYKLNGRPIHAANIVHIDQSNSESSTEQVLPSVTLAGADYEEYLKY